MHNIASILDKRFLPLLIAAFLLFGGAAGGETPAEALLGRYWFPEHDGQVELYRKGDLVFGRVVAYDVAGQLDEENPDPKLRTRPFLGIDMFKSFRFDAESGRWVDGTVYDGNSGRTYSGYLWFEDGDPSVLWARGFVGFSLFGRTERFDRVR